MFLTIKDSNNKTVKKHTLLDGKLNNGAKHLEINGKYIELTNDESQAGSKPRFSFLSKNGEVLYVKDRSLFLEKKSSLHSVSILQNAFKSYTDLKFNGVAISNFNEIADDATGMIEINEATYNSSQGECFSTINSFSGSLNIEGSSMKNMFGGRNSILEKVDVSKLNTSNITDMSYMFDGSWKISKLDLSNFDTSNVTDMSFMFSGTESLWSLNLSSFNTSKVTDMSYMFQVSNISNLDLSNFDTSNVTDMSGMFAMCEANNLDLSSFNTSNVTDMSSMFNQCMYLESLDLSSFNTSNVTDMSGMFSQCMYLESLDLSSFDISNVTNMMFMFYQCVNIDNLNLGDFSNSKVTDTSFMFYNSPKIVNIDISNFSGVDLEDASFMFADCTELETINMKNLNFNDSCVVTNIVRDCTSLKEVDMSGALITKQSVSKICTHLKNLRQQITVYVSDPSKHEGISPFNIIFAYK